MRKSRFTDEQITRVLAELEAGQSAAEVSRRHNVSAHTIYQWRKKFGALKAQDVRRMRGMQDEISKLKRIVADQAIELLAAKDLLRKNF
jgi:putative transposase